MSNQSRPTGSTALVEIQQELQRAERSNQPVSLVIVDVDDFELYCTHNGPEIGRKALQTIRGLLAKSCRETDLQFQSAAGVYSIVLPATSKLDAGVVAERICQVIRRTGFEGELKQPGGTLTATVGVATYPGDASDSAELAVNADRALYLAKASGKGRVQLYEDNRRSRLRKEVAVSGDFSTLEIHRHPLTTIDLSPSGVKFTTDRALPVGTLLDIRLRIPRMEGRVEMAVRVVRTEEVRPPSHGWISGRPQTMGGSYVIAARALEISGPDSRRLTRYLSSGEVA